MRKFFVILWTAAFLWGESAQMAQVQILAGKVTREGTTLKAEGDVVVYYRNKIFQADRAVYDTNLSTVKLYGHVTMLDGFDYTLLSDYAYIDLTKEVDIAKNFYMTDHSTELWIRGAKVEKVKEHSLLKKAFLSSCDVTCPDWHIEFSSAEYDAETEWLDVWNPRFYAGDVPIFYLPYIGTSLNRERRTGLLRPSIGFSGKDGFSYAQSLYIAVDPQWDLEITPQFRADRGAGAYATLRFVDTPHSYGSITAGYFKTKRSYVDEYDLKNESQYGVHLYYRNDEPLFGHSESLDDGFYADVTYLNDPDYLNLQSITSSSYYHSSQVMSRVNYFVNGENNYVGLYGRYYIDTRYDRDRQKETYQNAPSVQLHHYQSSLLGLDFAQYAFDYRYNFYFTESGKRIHFQEASLPVSFYGSLFDDYLKFAFTENLYYSYSKFSNLDAIMEENGFEDDYYSVFRNYHTFSLYTDLARYIGNQFHTMQLSVTYNKPGTSSENGNMVDYIQVLNTPRENMMLGMINYFYDEDGKRYLYYRVAQPVLYEPIDEFDEVYNRFGDLEQEVVFDFLDHYQLYTNVFYSYYLHDLTGASSYIKVTYPGVSFRLNHFFKQRLDLNEESADYKKVVKTSDFYSASVSYTLENENTIYGSVSYDNLNDELSRWSIGTHFYRRCWDLDIGIRDEIQPILNSGGDAGNIHNVMVYFTINIVPFGAFSYAVQSGQGGVL